jgi:hypothetical protein
MKFKFSTDCEEMVAQMLAKEINQQLRSGYMSDLTDIELRLREGLQHLGQQCLAQVINQQEGRYVAEDIPCNCGQRARYGRRRTAKSITLFGEVWYKRAYYLCSHCQQGQSPLDKELGIEPGKISAGLGPLLALLGIQAPFEASSARLAQELLLVEVSDNSVRKETQLMGQLQVEVEALQQEESQSLNVPQARAQAGAPTVKRLYGGIDGAIVPLRNEWRELKTGSWYLVEEKKGEVTAAKSKGGAEQREVGEQNHLQARALSYYCDITTAHEFGALVWAKGCQRLAHLAEEIVFVCDGAVWIWRLVEALFPRATQIVDWYHAAEYLPPIAHAAFGNSEAAQTWLTTQRRQLWDGEVAAVITACLALAEQAPKAAGPALAAATYFENNQARMDYARLRLEGYQIGSGPTESGCKQIAALRLKQAGARWSLSGAILTAKARAAWLSDEWAVLKQKRRQLALAA